ncbi:MAG: AAA family ATPase [Burkholderiales bacterium]
MPIIQEFVNQLRRKATPCASWHKIDLHNHSPASHDFLGDPASALADFSKEIREKRISVVMFTDHEKLPATDFLSKLSEATGALVLPGLELNVFVDAFGKPPEKVDKDLCFHLLVGFDPDGQHPPAYWYEHLHRQCRVEKRTFGNRSITGVATSVDHIFETLQTSGAFLIPAHLHSGPDAFRSRSIDIIYADSEFLRWTRKYFTALDVRNDKTAAYFDGKHPETGHLEVTCLRSSDAHRAQELGTYPSWVQMEHVSFAELRAAMELPSRVSREEPTKPSSYIVGIHIDGAFLRDFWMTFSPHSNVLIGVKGSGKTSILECLRFGLGTEVPSERAEEVNKHLAAILGPAGRVRLLLRRDDGAQLLVERRVTDRAFHVWFEDDRESVMQSPEALRFPAAILGWHEIEHAATDRQIRRLHMDAISGREEIKRLTDEAMLHAVSIRHLHDQAAAKYNEYFQLTAIVEQQEALRQGLQQLQDAKLIELRDQMSSALADRQEISRLHDHLNTLPPDIASRVSDVLRIGQFRFSVASPLSEMTSRANADVKELDHLANQFRDALTALVALKANATGELLRTATESFDRFSSNYQERLSRFPPEIQRLLESHREVLEKTRELPSLKVRLNDLKAQIEQSLIQLSDTSEKVAATLDARLDLRTRKIKEFNGLLAEALVTLSVVPGISRDDEFSSTFSKFGQTREVFQHLRAHHGATGRFHRTLAQSYRELRSDLMSGDRVVFARADFGHLITVLENDDLQIRFAVGKPGEQFSPIDQLSAGQRCTAVFPILLKLKDGPLVVDQPEDNLDNRHIARSVAPVLVSDKRSRQIIMTSHNANLVVLSDPECVAVFEGDSGTGNLVAAGFLSHRGSKVTSYVLDILDGGEKALELRAKKYGKTASI